MRRLQSCVSGAAPSILMLALSIAGCAGLPPKPKPVVLQSDAPLSDGLGAGGVWPAADWWKQYQDPTLDRLVEMAIASSPSLAAAQARFESARQEVRVASAATGAHLQANGDFSRQRLSDNGIFPPQLLGFDWYNLADLGLQATYTFDWWGKQRDSVQAALDEAHASQADRSAAALMLASSVADTYFGWQADRNRLALARERETAVLREGAIAAVRVRAELDPKDDLQRAGSALAEVREQIAVLDGSANLRVVALAALVGHAAQELPPLTEKPLPPVGSALPDDVRIDLIARRADITASRWRVEAAEQSRASARAEFFPDISINALIGVQSVRMSTLLNYGSRVPSIGAAAHLPLFDAGLLKARYGASQAALDQAVASYQDAVIGAARDVATQASTLAEIAAQRTQRAIELEAALELKASAAARVRQGVTDSRMELTATESWLEQRDALLQLDAAAVAADIGLKRALGGGYERTKTTP
jgi:multidrug efflux system outer membrane protein